MKKAKSPQDFSEKATDIMSLIKKFTSKSDESNPPKSNNGDLNGGAQNNNNNKQKFPQPPTYNYGAYAHIIENHDKKVKKIIAESEKQKDAESEKESAAPQKTARTVAKPESAKTGGKTAPQRRKSAQSKNSGKPDT